MKTKTYSIIKSAIINNVNTQAYSGQVVAESKEKALASIGAERPRLCSMHRGVNIFSDANGWTYLLAIA